ncbi:MAG: hypothetical protein M1819_002604 [Sarea resinae]|nr:MAG: hypothetical protein M1819_002604 [Sarea resinae]
MAPEDGPLSVRTGPGPLPSELELILLNYTASLEETKDCFLGLASKVLGGESIGAVPELGAFDVSLMVKKALDSWAGGEGGEQGAVDCAAAAPSIESQVSRYLNAEYLLYFLNQETPLSKNPFLLHWVEAVLDWRRRHDEHGGRNSLETQSPEGYRIEFIKCILTEEVDEFSDLCPRDVIPRLVSPSRGHGHEQPNMSHFITILQAEGLWDGPSLEPDSLNDFSLGDPSPGVGKTSMNKEKEEKEQGRIAEEIADALSLYAAGEDIDTCHLLSNLTSLLTPISPFATPTTSLSMILLPTLQTHLPDLLQRDPAFTVSILNTLFSLSDDSSDKPNSPVDSPATATMLSKSELIDLLRTTPLPLSIPAMDLLNTILSQHLSSLAPTQIQTLLSAYIQRCLRSLETASTSASAPSHPSSSSSPSASSSLNPSANHARSIHHASNPPPPVPLDAPRTEEDLLRALHLLTLFISSAIRKSFVSSPPVELEYEIRELGVRYCWAPFVRAWAAEMGV